MKNLKTRLKNGFLVLAAVVFMTTLAMPFAGTRTAEAASATSVTCNSATLQGEFGTNGAPTQVWFEWGVGTSLSNSTPHQTFNVGNATFQATITGLNENALYSFRARASNQYGSPAGPVSTFTTPPCQTTAQPTVNLTADTNNVPYNGSTTLRWTSNNATSCTANRGTNGWSGSRPLSGTFNTGALTTTTTYNITCSNSVGSATDSVTVTVGGSPIDRPTVSITADDTSIDSGDSTIVRWNSNFADTCVGSGGTNGWSGTRNLSGTFNTGALTSTRTYTITCSNNSGSATDSVTINVGSSGNRPTVDLRADDTTIDSGDNTILRWDSDNADTCRASGGRNGWSGTRNTSGTFNTGDLTSSTTYHITCTNDYGSADDSVTVRVNDDEEDPTVNIYANPSSVVYGGTSSVRWDSDNADDCTAYGGTNSWSGSRSTSGTFYTGALYSNTTFSITCRNDNGSANDSVTVSVNGVQVDNTRPTLVLYADSTSLPFNGSTTVRWNTTNATSCYASGGSAGWAGSRSIGPGSFFTGSLTGTRTYSMTCSNNAGSTSDFVTVNVRGQVLGATTPASAYLVVSSSVDRNRPIVPTLDNTNPCPGDDINYTLTYQNVGNASLRNLVLRIELPVEVDFLSASPVMPNQSGNSLIFNLGTLGANKEGKVTIRTRLQDGVPAGTNLNFPATMTYVDPSGATQSVSANVSANVCGEVSANQIENDNGTMSLGAAVFGAGFLPNSILGWLLLIILILILVVLARHLFAQSFTRRRVTTYNPATGQNTTTTL